MFVHEVRTMWSQKWKQMWGVGMLVQFCDILPLDLTWIWIYCKMFGRDVCEMSDMFMRVGNTKHADTSHHTYPGTRQGVTYRNHYPLCCRSWQWTQVASCPGPQPTTGWHLHLHHGSRNSPHSSPGWYLHLPFYWPHLQRRLHCWRHCHSGLDLLWKK